MNSSYSRFEFNSIDEVFVALLSQIDFDSFVEEEGITKAYIKTELLDEKALNDISELCDNFAVRWYREEEPQVNWNSVWEENFVPVEVEQEVRVRADFHPASDKCKHEIIINPKMSFGTGHHETTYMMLKMMSSMDFKDQEVFDFGSGTGILAIYAKMLGAKRVLGIDNEEWAFENSLENQGLNGISDIDFRLGSIDLAAGLKFDILLANITKNVLLNYKSEILECLRPQGTLLLSGILQTQKEEVIEQYEIEGLKLEEMTNRNAWVCLKFNF
ncbi:MAG TPA: 50S ribosomal protein L11 methyltransferase [Saprospiraceae bacterium]|nr:50S ribosomal protein L11 methyltransferase [Saprospiraceae bacterium]